MTYDLDDATKPDLVVFKYRAINPNLLRSLEESTLYFSDVARLNDPYDCQVDIEASLARAINASTGDVKRYLVKLRKTPVPSRLPGGLLKLGICSFSLDLLNPLLWAHYGAEHRGLCLTYRIPQSFVLDKNRFLGSALVRYGINPLRDWFMTVAPSLGPGTRDSPMGAELTKLLITIKSECWAYEKELRMIREIPGPLEIPREFLVQVCFGLRTSPDDIQKVQSKIKHDVPYCRTIRAESDFGLEAIKINKRSKRTVGKS